MTIEEYMHLALEQAEKAFQQQEVPVGAIVVRDDIVIASGYNQRETLKSPIAHAEIIALSNAAKALGGWRLERCWLYVTMEPCAMCAGAIINSRIDTVVFGAYDQKAGCCGTLYNLCQDRRFNHRPNVIGGILEQDCISLLQAFFKERRKNDK